MTDPTYQTYQFPLTLAEPNVALSGSTAGATTASRHDQGLADLNITVVVSLPSHLTDAPAPLTLPITAQRLDEYCHYHHQIHHLDSSKPQDHTSANRLHLSYYIHLPWQTQTLVNFAGWGLDWPAWQSQNVGFSHYLWHRTCLECFISGRDDEYVEINASPAGQFALYHFQDYRSPATMPPPPLQLLSVDQTGRLEPTNQATAFHWLPSAQYDCQISSFTTHGLNRPSVQSLHRHFSIALDRLPGSLFPLTQLHPCVILKFDDTPLYFAPNHAPKPDFHDRHYWIDIANHPLVPHHLNKNLLNKNSA